MHSALYNFYKITCVRESNDASILYSTSKGFWNTLVNLGAIHVPYFTETLIHFRIHFNKLLLLLSNSFTV